MPSSTPVRGSDIARCYELVETGRPGEANSEIALSYALNKKENTKPILLYVTIAFQSKISGDAVYDRNIIEVLNRRFDVRTICLLPLNRLSLLVAMLLHFLPPVYARYFTMRNRRLLRAALRSETPVATILSNESLAPLSICCPPSTTSLIFHNIHSRIRAVSILERLLLPWYRRTERRLLQRPHTKFFLAEPDADYACHSAGGTSIAATTVPPGVPQHIFGRPLVPIVAREVVLTGSLGWYRKRRDLNWFIQELGPRMAAEVVTDLDCEFPAHWPRHGYAHCDWDKHYRIGVIPERFSAGFKLKTLDLICRNCVVVSFADLSADFRNIKNYEEFVIHLTTPEQFVDFVNTRKSKPDSEFADRFEQFKIACRNHFSWERSGTVIAQHHRPQLPVLEREVAL